MAIYNGHLNVVKYLVENGTNIHIYNNYGLRGASKNGHLDVVKHLVENGANVQVWVDASLRLASINGHLDVVKYLVENGANIQAENDYSLRMASNNGHLDVVRYLISIYIERNKYKELLNHFDRLPEEIKEELKLKIPHIFAALDHGLI